VRRHRPLPAGVLLLLVGCAPTLTPQQEWVMTKFEECRTKTGGWNARLDRVDPDGRYHVTVHQTQTDYNRVQACMDEEWRRDPPKKASPR
jgi:hypothetical protein